MKMKKKNIHINQIGFSKTKFGTGIWTRSC